MPFNLLLLPLLGGYILVTRLRWTRYQMLRADGQRLVLSSALAGVILLMVATALHEFIRYGGYQWYHSWAPVWHRIAPFPYSGVTVLALLLSVPGYVLMNIFQGEGSAIDRVIKRKADPFEMLLHRCFNERKMIALTVKNGKVYVGYITTVLNPGLPVNSIGIFPQISGYRDPTEKGYRFTTDYIQVHKRIAQELEQLRKTFIEEAGKEEPDAEALARLRDQWSETFALKDFEHVIPTAEIQSIHIFVPKIFTEHFSTTDSRAVTSDGLTGPALIRPVTGDGVGR